MRKRNFFTAFHSAGVLIDVGNQDFISDPEGQKDWDTIESDLNLLHKALKELISFLREEYVKVNLDSTNIKAWNCYIDSNKE